MSDIRNPWPRPAATATAMAAALVLALSGCAVGPDYQRPATPLDPGFIVAGSTATTPAPVEADIATFWRAFGDPALTTLVERALAANGDVRVAQARLQEARANLGEADAAARPEAGVDASARRSIRALSLEPDTSRAERTGTVYDAAFIANWELDLFGRYRRGSEAAAAQVDASQAGLYAVHTSVAAEVARNYLDLRGQQQRLRIAQSALVNQRESARITQVRFEAGRGTRLDVERARGLVASTEATLPALQGGIERTVFRIATLTAQPPSVLLAGLGEPAPLPGLPVTDLSRLPLGTPEQWLLRRPDVAVAERELAAATARIGVARADLYPRLSLSGLIGLNASTFGNLGNRDAALYSLGVGLVWAPFDGGAIRARIAAAEARTQGSLASYEQAVAVALEETEGAFSSYNRNAARAERLAVAAGHAQQAASLARVRYGAGAADFLVVLDAEREVLSAEDSLMQAQADTAGALVGVYRALGGGWSAEPATQAAAASP